MLPQSSAVGRPTLDPATTDETPTAIFAAQRHDPDRIPAQLHAQREAGLALIAALRPRDPIEAAYASRADAAHYAFMACFRRAVPTVAATDAPPVPDPYGWIPKAAAFGGAWAEMRTKRGNALWRVSGRRPRPPPVQA